MGKKKKQYIDKKHSTTYRLVHRSQHDPLAADNDANQMVLNEVGNADVSRSEAQTRLTQQKECGIYYDDDYDYMQHMRDRDKEEGVVWEAANPTQPGKVTLPVSVFPSLEEEPIGLLNLAAPRGLDLSLDPDIVAALDDDFDFEDPENELEDDFMAMADGELDVISEEGSNVDSLCQFSDDVDSLGGQFSDDGQCRFTEYSVSSSVLPRNEGLTLLDDKFEEMFKEYDEMGAVEEDLPPVDEPKDEPPTLLLQQLCIEFDRDRIDEEADPVLDKLITLQLAASQTTERTELVKEEFEERIPWDCETILSTYTNIYNHPTLITIPPKIKLNKKGIVVEEEALEEEEEEEEDADDDDDENTIYISNLRTKSETPEEKRLRKKAVKDSQKLRRLIKKATKEVFKEEITKETKIHANTQRKTLKL